MFVRCSRRWGSVAALAGLFAWCLSGLVRAQDPKNVNLVQPLDEKGLKRLEADRKDLSRTGFAGTNGCINCHALGDLEKAGAQHPLLNDKARLARLDEYSTWQTQDKHALAYVALVS